MKRPIKILFTIPNLITAGSGRALANLVLGLDRERFTPYVCVSRRGGTIEAELEAQGVTVIESPFTVQPKPYTRLVPRCKAAAKVFKPFEFDLWHSFHYADDYTEPLIARFSGVKTWIYSKKNMMWGGNAWHVRSLLASRIIAVNQDMSDRFFHNLFYKKKIQLIARGIDIIKFIPTDKLNQKSRVQLELPDDGITVGLLAHIVPIKGHHILIAAVKQVPEVHLVFAGRMDDQDFLAQLEEEIKEQNLVNRVHFLGQVDNVPEFVNAMDIIVLPTLSRGEGCPVALLEAMACGKACIATDVPGSRDLIQDGISGLLVRPEDPSALADALQCLGNDRFLRAQLGAAARQRVMEHFTIEKEIAAHEQLYYQVLRKQ